MKKLFFLKNIFFKTLISILICFGFISLATSANAITESSQSGKPQITYPIAELGGCASKDECRSYCEQEENKQACIDFGNKKGIYKENKDKSNARDRLVFEKAKSELGCSTKDACKSLCESPENSDKCKAFAAKYGLKSPQKNTDSTLLEKAKEVLGCESADACRELCQKSDNRQKCKEIVLKLGEAVTEKIQKECTEGKECELLKKNAENLRELQKKCQESAAECLKKKAEIEKKLKEQKSEICKKDPKECEEMKKNVGKAQEAALERAKLCKEKPDECHLNLNDIEKATETEDEGDVKGVSKISSFFENLLSNLSNIFK